ncbi:MAG: hypothetical protein ABMA01_04550 [Chthoniobacteraceae bacterium]
MKLSKEARKLSKQLFRESFTGGALDSAKVGAVTDTVIRAKPRQYIGVLKEFARLIRLEAARRHAIIESAARRRKPAASPPRAAGANLRGRRPRAPTEGAVRRAT